jgi:hypothetical protein
MHTDEKAAHVSPLLRVGGTFIGAILSAFAGAVLFIVAAVLDMLPHGVSFLSFVVGIGLAGAFVGLLLPRQTIDSLWFFAPEIFD